MKKNTTYTEEDFKTAVFARHPDGRIAARVDSGNLGWWAGGNERAEPSWRDDYDMAEEGFVPVREAQPVTLDALRDAWESAEVADECNEGDVLIHRYSGSSRKVEVWEARRPGVMLAGTRILHRAPKRPEGAEALSLLIQQAREASEWADDADAWADWLAERGVRVTGGGDG